MPGLPTELADFAAGSPMDSSLESVGHECRRYMRGYLARIPPGEASHTTSAMSAEADQLLQERTLHILLLLDMASPLGFNAVARALSPISTRTLARKLSLLQRKGLVKRSLVDNPPHVEYRLTDAGRRLTALLFPALVFIGDRALASAGGEGLGKAAGVSLAPLRPVPPATWESSGTA